jgi:hypothetical protein
MKHVCGPQCEAMPKCRECGMRKAPYGRSVPLESASGYCGWYCPGYCEEPMAGHLWPGELRDEEDE